MAGSGADQNKICLVLGCFLLLRSQLNAALVVCSDANDASALFCTNTASTVGFGLSLYSQQQHVCCQTTGASHARVSGDVMPPPLSRSAAARDPPCRRSCLLARVLETTQRSHTTTSQESGLRFHYVAAGERGKPLMLFLHGFPEFWFSWRYQLREFKSEFRVVAVDMRGYGESDLPLSSESYRFDYLVTDVKDIVEYLGYNRCCLVGHDWGGTIAWLFAIHYPEMVTKLIVLNCPHPSVFADYALRHPSQLLKSSHYFFFQLPCFPELMLSINDFKAVRSLFTSRSTGIGRKGRWLTTEDLEAYLYALSQPGALTGALNYFRNVFSSLPLNQNHVRAPVLLLWGERDAFLEQEMAEACRLYIRNHFRLNIISGASHWLQQDQPDIVNTLIWTFLKEGEGRKSYRT
ncbi:epoxide hydrolase 4 isoform X1 [Synchiropus splendidus]|uniref:epoxide hydrolase 4 isoform X1 n=1 Tax=Synchiropus splendidus TaxID=270530 RepID=UPI00237DEFF4|nr:epoxide hydrolase 4 isoform X1 [Synchiropus splendidus]